VKVSSIDHARLRLQSPEVQGVHDAGHWLGTYALVAVVAGRPRTGAAGIRGPWWMATSAVPQETRDRGRDRGKLSPR
jgi:hypothetical protein